MQRSGTHKVLGRGRGHAVLGQIISARVLKGRRAVADAGRWAALTKGKMLSTVIRYVLHAPATPEPNRERTRRATARSARW
jgi:hypothetical protein